MKVRFYLLGNMWTSESCNKALQILYKMPEFYKHPREYLKELTK